MWYKTNEAGRSGWNIPGSENYSLSEYVNNWSQNQQMNNEIFDLVKSLENGLTGTVEILVAYDISLNAGLIVDGTKRAIALHYLKQKDEKKIEELINSKKYSINILQLKSPNCRILFPLDFLKLSQKNAA